MHDLNSIAHGFRPDPQPLADANGDGFVQIEELLPNVRDRVVELSGGAQRPEYSRVEGGGNFRLSRTE